MKLLAASSRGISMESLFFNTRPDAGNLTVKQVKTHEIPLLQPTIAVNLRKVFVSLQNIKFDKP